MSEDNKRPVAPYKGGVFSDLANRIKLIIRLMADGRVNPFIKLIPVVSLVYLIFPDFAPGPIDDAMFIWLGAYLFVELCPPDVVQEHMAAIERTIPGKWQDVPPQGEYHEEVIDSEFRDDR